MRRLKNLNSIKRIFIVLLLIFSLFLSGSCKENNMQEFKEKDIKPIVINNNQDVKLLSIVNYPSFEKKYNDLNNNLKDILNQFSFKFTNEIFNNKNELFSPISLFYACSMLEEGITCEEVKNELDTLLGIKDISKEDLNQELKKIYLNNYYSNDSGRTYMTNSLWIKNDFNVKESYVNTLKENYFAESYNVNFSSNVGKKTIIDWINHYTEDLLKLDLSNYEIDDSLVLLLINTIYFNNKWAVDFNKDHTNEDLFYLSKDNNVSVPFMNHTITSLTKKTNDYLVCQDYFYNENKITYIMPNDYDLNSLKKYQYSEFYKDLKYSEVNLTVPKFEFFGEYNLTETFNKLGVSGIFNPSKNAFKNIADDIVVDFIKQNTGIILNEQGVEAAAVTSIGMKTTSVGPSFLTYIKLHSKINASNSESVIIYSSFSICETKTVVLTLSCFLWK